MKLRFAFLSYTELKCKEGHSMQAFGAIFISGWSCNGKTEYSECLRDLEQKYECKGICRYRCEVCDYDLCNLCFARELNFSKTDKSH